MSVAIVTGGSRGFGYALATRLASEGWTVVADGRRADDLSGLHAVDPTRLLAVPGDVCDPAHRAELIAAAARAGGIDLLVLNASTLGGSPLPAIAALTPPALSHIFAVNVEAPLALTRSALPHLQKSAQPTIVALSSDAAVEAYPTWGGYGASKAALDHLMAVLAAENEQLAVYAFDPGDMRTDMHQQAFPGEDISDRPEPATVVPVLLDLLRERPASGRYRAADRSLQEATA